MMDTRDAEHELNIEISENDVRKGFTKSERVDYIKRLLRIEQAKAKERQMAGTSASNNAEVGRSDEATAKQFDMSATTMRRNFTGSELAEGLRRQMAIEAEKARERQTLGETLPEGSGGRARDKAGAAFGISGRQAEKVLFIADNADMLDPADFEKGRTVGIWVTPLAGEPPKYPCNLVQVYILVMHISAAFMLFLHGSRKILSSPPPFPSGWWPAQGVGGTSKTTMID